MGSPVELGRIDGRGRHILGEGVVQAAANQPELDDLLRYFAHAQQAHPCFNLAVFSVRSFPADTDPAPVPSS